VVHIIDTVLTVPATPAQTAINTGLTSLAGALTAAGLVDAVNSLSDVTIFAPSNDAFRAIGSALGTLSTQDLVSILGFHVLPGQVRFSPNLLAADQMSLATLQGTNVTIRRDGANVFVNSARVILTDVLTTNGVVHVLDKSVLFRSRQRAIAFGLGNTFVLTTLPSVLNPSNTSATPDLSAATQAPAFAGVTAVAEAPLTSGIVPTTTIVPATILVNAVASAGAVPTAGLVLAGAAALAANL
jgi:uncharacterized surface protein with fasciclin (FAS1) repeats